MGEFLWGVFIGAAVVLLIVDVTIRYMKIK